MKAPLPNFTKRYKLVFTPLAVVKVSLRLASYVSTRTATILAPSSMRDMLVVGDTEGLIVRLRFRPRGCGARETLMPY